MVLKDEITAEARRLGADLVGFAPVERWAEYGEVPAAYRPEAIFPRAQGSVIGNLDKDACNRHHIPLRNQGNWPTRICAKVIPEGADRRLYGNHRVKPYLEERAALAKDPVDPRYKRLTHLRGHGSRQG